MKFFYILISILLCFCIVWGTNVTMALGILSSKVTSIFSKLDFVSGLAGTLSDRVLPPVFLSEGSLGKINFDGNDVDISLHILNNMIPSYWNSNGDDFKVTMKVFPNVFDITAKFEESFLGNYLDGLGIKIQAEITSKEFSYTYNYFIVYGYITGLGPSKEKRTTIYYLVTDDSYMRFIFNTNYGTLDQYIMTDDPLKKIIALPNIRIDYPQYKKNEGVMVESTDKLVNQWYDTILTYLKNHNQGG